MKKDRGFVVLVLTLLAVGAALFPTAKANESCTACVQNKTNLAFIDEAISIYVGNLTEKQKYGFLTELNSTYGLRMKIGDLANSSLSPEKKEVVWKAVKQKQQIVARERKMNELRQEEALKNTTAYKKKLFYNNLSFYLDSLNEEEKKVLIEEFNYQNNLNLTIEDFYDESSAAREKIEDELRERINILDQEEKKKLIIPISEFMNGSLGLIDVFGENVSVKTESNDGEDKFIISSNRVTSVTNLSLSVDNSYVGEGNVIRAQISDGRSAALRILPDKALEIAHALSKARCTGCAIKLKEEDIGGRRKVVYEIDARKEVKLLFIISKSMKSSIYLDAESGELADIREPWWSMLAWE